MDIIAGNRYAREEDGVSWQVHMNKWVYGVNHFGIFVVI